MNASLASRNLAHRRLVIRWTGKAHATSRRTSQYMRKPDMREYARRIARRVWTFESGGTTWNASYISGRQVLTEVQA